MQTQTIQAITGWTEICDQNLASTYLKLAVEWTKFITESLYFIATSSPNLVSNFLRDTKKQNIKNE